VSLSDYLACWSEPTAKLKFEMMRLRFLRFGDVNASLCRGPKAAAWRRVFVVCNSPLGGGVVSRPQRHLLAPTLMNPWLPTGTPTLIPTPTDPPHPFAESIDTTRTSIPATRTTVRMASLPVLRPYLLQCEQRPSWVGNDGHGPVAKLW
jgi:hypothetical protein